MRFCLALATLLYLLLSPCVFSAPDPRERIIDFHSDITLEPDGIFLVRETITVNAAGSRIRHGIFRDFPTRYKDRFGNNYVVGFALLSAEYDGNPEKTSVQEQLQGKRIYLGDQKLFVPPG